jgi:type I restriction enzyme S subunit
MTLAWQTRPLAEVAELRGRIGWKGLTAKEYTPEGPYFLSVHSLNYGACVDFRDAFHISQQRYDESPEIMLRLDDVLICKDGAGIGKVGIVGDLPGPSTVNSSLLLIRSKPNVLPKYLYHVLQSPYFQDIVKSRLEGATTPHLYQRDIATFPVHLPPLEEQQRIVDVLDEVFDRTDSAIAITQAAQQSLIDLRSALTLAQISALGSQGERIALKDVARVQSGYAFRSQDYVDQGHFLVRIGNVQDGELASTSPRYVQLSQATSRFELDEGDILVSLTGNVGRVALVEERHLPAALNQRVARVQVNPAQLNRDFLLVVLQSQHFRDRLSESGHGTAQLNVSPKALADFVVPVPSLAAQAQALFNIAKVDADLARLETVYARKLRLLAELKQSILSHAFSGELTREPLAA